MEEKELRKIGRDFIFNCKVTELNTMIQILNKYRDKLPKDMWRRECDAHELELMAGIMYQRTNTPLTGEFFESVRNEAAHQKQRWGKEHDESKTDEDWFWTLGFLAGKALHNVRFKKKHHIIAAAALLMNWYESIGD